MWHVRLLTEDGDVLEEATLASFTDVVDITNRHVDIVNAEVARGRSVTLEITDPDGVVPPMAVIIEPRSWN